ncbi:MAG: UTP--glucose-1-phosphate uridylyltransferase, partial [Desulfobacterales bacterium]
FDERFAEGIPSLIDCESLTIEGDVRFEKNVTLKGNVVIKNSGKSQMVIKQGSVIDESVD